MESRNDQHVPEPMVLTIRGNSFKDLEGFYGEMDKVLTKDLDFETGHNLDALNDLLRGDFGVYEYGESVRLVWKDHRDSREALGGSKFDQIVELIREHRHIELLLD